MKRRIKNIIWPVLCFCWKLLLILNIAQITKILFQFEWLFLFMFIFFIAIQLNELFCFLLFFFSIMALLEKRFLRMIWLPIKIIAYTKNKYFLVAIFTGCLTFGETKSINCPLVLDVQFRMQWWGSDDGFAYNIDIKLLLFTCLWLFHYRIA